MSVRLLASVLIIFCLASITVNSGSIFATPVSLESMLDEMIDRSSLASFPHPAYTCKQASSYDRHSKAPDKPGWFANDDRSYYLRNEINEGRKEWVMLDAKGPGAIVRWWGTEGTRNYNGTVRIYIDGSSKPVVEARVGKLVGGNALIGPPFSARRATGSNLYLPIPYAKHCKITCDGPNFHITKNRGHRHYYAINYRTYAPGTKVESFSMAGFEAAKEKIAKIQNTLLKPDSVNPGGVNRLTAPDDVTIPAGEEFVKTLNGPAAICRMSVCIEADDVAQALRSTVLVVEFDGEQTVWCPLGDFIGSGVGVNPFKDWYRQMEKDGTMTCRWVMPFKESCVIRLKNLGKQEIRMENASLDTCPWTWNGRSMHFHATWRQQHNIHTETKGGNAFDWNYLSAKGRGVFAGDTLSLVNKHQGWWGEGDEKIFVDGEKFPSHFGTGTEDYYGYAWSGEAFFESPFHAQPRVEGPGHFGNTTNTRVRLLDDIPFNKSFRFDMEVWNHFATTMNLAVATYWYGRPGATANHKPSPDEAAQPVNYITPNPPPPGSK